MRKLIVLAIATYVWKRLQARIGAAPAAARRFPHTP